MVCRTHNVGQEFIAACNLLDIDPDQILRETGLQRFSGNAGALSVTPKQLASIHAAIVAAYGQDDFHIKLATGFAQGPFGHTFLALQCSETFSDGVYRVAQFKALLEPVKWTITETDTSFAISVRSVSQDFPFNGFRQITCFLWLVLSARNVTAKRIVPSRVCITEDVTHHARIEREMGCPVELGTHPFIEFKAQVMDTLVLSANRYVLSGLDVGAKALHRENTMDQGFVELVYTNVLELLPSGAVTSDRVAKHLAVSKRTLERKLSDQGTSFTDVLRNCRLRMANHYLHQTSLPITEIAFLVGYREINSFYRAFKAWHGLTPRELRDQKMKVSSSPRAQPQTNRF